MRSKSLILVNNLNHILVGLNKHHLSSNQCHWRGESAVKSIRRLLDDAFDLDDAYAVRAYSLLLAKIFSVSSSVCSASSVCSDKVIYEINQLAKEMNLEGVNIDC